MSPSKAESLSILISFLLLTINPVINSNLLNRTEYLYTYREYTLLISDVQKYYQASSVVLMHSGDDSCICVSTLMADLIHELSSKFVLSQSFHFHQDFNTYQEKIARPLFVVFLNSTWEVENFQRLTTYIEVSNPFWLVIFTQPELHICYKPQFNYFNVAFDTEMMIKCYGNSTLREWYSLDVNNIMVDYVANWDLVNRFQHKTNDSLYQRRHSLGGKMLRIAMVKESPFIETENGTGKGFYSMILDELSSSLNFQKTIVYKEDGYGMYDESSGEWSGVIGRIHKKEADVGVAEFTMTGRRLDFVDFTLPILLSRNFLYLRQPDDSDFQWSAYFRVYTVDSWIATQAIYALSCLVITCISIKVLIGPKRIALNHVSEYCFFVWGAFCQQGLPDFPTACPLRIAYFTVFLFDAFFLAIYSACLISYLTIVCPSSPFTTLEEFAKDGTYKLIAFHDSADYTFLETSQDVVLKKMMKLMLDKDELPKNPIDGFRQICRSGVAFYATEAIKTQVSYLIPCKLAYVQSGRIDSLSLVLPKKSQYKGVINHHLQKFKDVGIMNRLQFSSYVRVTPLDNKYNPVHVRSIGTLLMILGVGVIFSIAILFCEISIHRARNNKETNKLGLYKKHASQKK